MLDVCYDPMLYDEYRTMVERGNKCQDKLTCRYTVTFVTAVCFAEVLFLPTFLAQHVACGNGNDQRVGCCMGWWTEHAACHGT